MIYNTTDCDDGWFGRKHVLLFGDLLQLPPVLEDPAFIHLTEEKIRKYLGSLSATNLWTNLFDYDDLTINLRQQGDESYRELLSRIRVGFVVERVTNKLRHPNVASLRAAIEAAFANMDSAALQRACGRFRTRMEAVIETNGGYIE
ncbi:hypothetical protein ALC62_02492 [Cyphomyrmex costatus]|uniref:DNA helicase n=1 Tax=Cyphomyrmex costatus TaxID=456900 RepID=A0A151IN23_9HYME|nr:hypothetical protein ALC62_02492 [Cyphomyrmex costatus]